jgi:hypothetical protein
MNPGAVHYSGDIVAGSLLVRESRILARLLLEGVEEPDWRHAIDIDNVLQKGSPTSARRQARLIKSRLTLMEPALWRMVVEGGADVATQALLAAAVKQSRLLADFMRHVVKSHWRVFQPNLSAADWRTYIETCAQVDPAAAGKLEGLFAEKGDILKNQLAFTCDGASLKQFNAASDFVGTYPFIPYHFQLVQKIFESIRKAGATGLHLSRGERSMLDAFQSAAINIADREIGALVPLYEFFPCIESFLDTAVKRGIDQAKENAGLDIPFDVRILQTLFLIRYVEIIKPNIDNLATLCIDEADTDRISLKRAIEASLDRLEKQHLINRNGDLYFFLTNEEREVAREIKFIDIPLSAGIELLGEILFDDILGKKTKHRYADYKRDYAFNRICDGRFWGKEIKDALALEIISPLHEDYDAFIPAKCVFFSADRQSHAVVKLPNNPDLPKEIRTYLQTQTYIKHKSDAAASTSLKQILRDRAEGNRERKQRLTGLVESMFVEAEFYALGKAIEVGAGTPARAVDAAFNHLVENVFSKFGYLTHVYDDPQKEIKETLRSDDVARRQLTLAFETGEPADIREIRTYIDLNVAANHPVYLDGLAAHFAKPPYGWGEFQTIVRVARLFMAGHLNLVIDGGKVQPKEALAPLTKTHQWKTVKIAKRKIPSEKDIKKAQTLGKELFGSIAPDGQDNLSRYIRDGLNGWIKTLETYKPLADTGKYPGKPEIDGCLAVARQVTEIHDAYERIKVFNNRKTDLEDAADDLHDLTDFYTHQRQTWETLRDAMDRFKVNAAALAKDPDAGPALKKMAEILHAPRPYGSLKDVNGLIAAVQDDKNRWLMPLQRFKKQIQDEYSIPQITYYVKEAQETFEEEWVEIEDAFQPEPDKENKPEKPVQKVRPADCNVKPYLDTEEDVEKYVGKLKGVLLDGVREGRRVKIV